MEKRELKHYDSLEDMLKKLLGNNAALIRRERISGGDINEASGLMLQDGSRVFLKSNTKDRASLFTSEAAGLRAIGETNTIRVPKILGSGVLEREGRSFLLLEFVESRGKISGYWETFAQELAAMHRTQAGKYAPGGKFGFENDNFLGSGRQENTPKDSWTEFFRECRLRPCFRKTGEYFSRDEKKRIERLLDRLDRYLTEPEQPSLVHGDLWGGNFITGSDGKAWLIDPAAYVGNAEADIAMTELFGGFSPVFYRAYKEAGLLKPGYEERRNLYQLYHLLNHLFLFGQGYLPSVLSVLYRYS